VAIIARCRDPKKRQGLIWHHQGSGKTFAMAYAAAKLRHQTDMDAPTIVVVLDRIELIQQTTQEFKSVGIQSLKVAESKDDLRRMLRDDARGVIITTIYRFAEAGLLNDRTNIVVMVVGVDVRVGVGVLWGMAVFRLVSAIDVVHH
jgi:type I restriction enzyme R subunit